MAATTFMSLAALFWLTSCKNAPEASTPKQAAVSFAKAAEAGDIDMMKQVAIGTDAEFELAKGLGQAMRAVHDYEAAAMKKFGEQGKLPKGMSMDLVSAFESSTEKLEGDDKASLILKDSDDTDAPTLKKQGNSWKLELNFLDRNPEAARSSKNLLATAAALNSVKKQINDGTYKTATEAFKAMKEQVSAATPKAEQ